MAHALRAGAGFHGSGELQLLALMEKLLVEVRRQYRSLSDEILARRDHNLISNTSQASIETFIANHFVSAFERHYPETPWVDPNPECERGAPAIHACSTAATLFPKARFICVIRRPIDLILHLRALGGPESHHHWCCLWRESTSAWAEVRELLGPRCIEVHHHLLATDPQGSAAKVGDFLGLAPQAIAGIQAQLERSFCDAAGVPRPYRWVGLDETPWNSDQRAIFDRQCGELSLQMGYGVESLRLR